jgi:hypothetical protein
MATKGLVLAAVLAAALSLPGPASAAVAPASGVDGDGTADMLARGTDGRVWLFPGDGSAPPTNPWQWATRRVVGSDWNFVDRMIFGDVTGDGRQDIYAREGTLFGGTLWIYTYDSTQPATPWTSRIFAGTGWNIALVIMTGDVTGDSRTDIVTRESDGRMWLYPHNGNLASPYTTRQVIGANWQSTNMLLLSDVTGDGLLDIVARDLDGFLWIYPQPSARTGLYWDFRSRQRLRVDDAPYDAGGGWEVYNQLMITDVTGDGRPDMMGRDTAGVVRVFPHGGTPPGVNPWPRTTSYPTGDWWRQYSMVLVA